MVRKRRKWLEINQKKENICLRCFLQIRRVYSRKRCCISLHLTNMETLAQKLRSRQISSTPDSILRISWIASRCLTSTNLTINCWLLISRISEPPKMISYLKITPSTIVAVKWPASSMPDRCLTVMPQSAPSIPKSEILFYLLLQLTLPDQYNSALTYAEISCNSWIQIRTRNLSFRSRGRQGRLKHRRLSFSSMTKGSSRPCLIIDRWWFTAGKTT